MPEHFQTVSPGTWVNKPSLGAQAFARGHHVSEEKQPAWGKRRTRMAPSLVRWGALAALVSGALWIIVGVCSTWPTRKIIPAR